MSNITLKLGIKTFVLISLGLTIGIKTFDLTSLGLI